jgi:NAD(P)-dependent dehydrogenase (short-subunit alcohol dehydrogenase family)
MRPGRNTPVVITGGASGLGAAAAHALARRGAPVAILDLDVARGTRVAGEVHGLFCQADVTDPAAVADAFDRAAAAHGPARIALACAGIAPAARTVDREGRPHDSALFARVLAVNALGSFHLASEAASRMTALDPLTEDGERGVVVATASIAAFEGQIGQIAYAASKGAVAAMVLPMARDLARAGIRVVAIAPGLFLTPMHEGLPPDAQAGLGSQVPFPARLGRPDEFAALVMQITENPMLNGSVIRLDGAIRMGPR